jgi:hypothetical protein
MTVIRKLTDLPAHQPLAMSPKERASLDEATWEAYTAPNYHHLMSTNTLGTWYIGSPRMVQLGRRPSNVGLDPAAISYMAGLSPGEIYGDSSSKMDAFQPDDVEWLELFSHAHQQELGYAFSQDYARLFVDIARRQEASLSPEQVLLSAGFSFEHKIPASSGREATQVYRKPAPKSGEFSVFLSTRSLSMMHQAKSSNYWTNLLNLRLFDEAQDGHLRPIFWSREVINPIAAAAECAVEIVKDWIPGTKAKTTQLPVLRKVTKSRSSPKSSF